jgi:hypothetical protein
MTACARLNYPKRNVWEKEDVELVRCASRITAIGASGNYSLTPLVGAKIAVTEAKSRRLACRRVRRLLMRLSESGLRASVAVLLW